MTDSNIMRHRFVHRMTNDFVPQTYPSGQGFTPEQRTADASEYTAYHLGQLNKKIDRLIELIEALSSKP